MAITSRVIAGSDPKMKKSKKFSTKIILKVKNLSINLVLFERENFQNLKVMKVKKNFQQNYLKVKNFTRPKSENFQG